jgi:hypothetical protein
MKKIILILLFCLILIPFICDAQQIFISKKKAGGGVPNPDVYYTCEDNASNITVTATYGSNGSLGGSGTSDYTSANTSTTYFAGSRSWQPNDDTSFLAGVVTEASMEDGEFTIQFAYYADNTSGFGAGNYVRFFMDADAGTQILMWSNSGSSTDFQVYIAGTDYAVTLDDVNTASWHVIRVVVDTGESADKLRVYQGTTESNLTLKYESNASAVSAPSMASTGLLFGGNGNANRSIQLRNGKMDEIKIWYTAVVP